MWKLLNISASNLCAFKKIDYNINQGKTTLVFGNNQDNESQKSNGSGKSALIEAIAIGLTGDFLRDVKSVSELINDACEEAKIQITLENGIERMCISRTLSRKNAQEISVSCSACGSSDDEKIVKANVSDYNSYILDKIGLTKDEIFSNYILSKHKYKSFLSSPDKDKKEIINNFSNGIIVDESIECLENDMCPIQNEFSKCESAIATCNGKLEAIDEQIENAKNNIESQKASNDEKINNCKIAIVNKRAIIREENDKINGIEDDLDKVDEAYNKCVKLEDSDLPFKELHSLISKAVNTVGVDTSSYYNKFESFQQKIDEYKSIVKQKSLEYKKMNEEHNLVSEKYTNLKNNLDNLVLSSEKKSIPLRESISSIGEKLSSIDKKESELFAKLRDINSVTLKYENILSGVIVCPKCHHEFLLDNDVDVHELKEKVKDGYSSIDSINKKIDGIEDDRKRTENEKSVAKESLICIENDLDKKKHEVSVIREEVDGKYNSLITEKRRLDNIQDELSEVTRSFNSCKSEMFENVFSIIDEKTRELEKNKTIAEGNIETAKGSILSYEETINNINNIACSDIVGVLENSKKKYSAEMKELVSKKNEVESTLAKYREQEANFIEFKTHLANTKIEALGKMTNDFLEAIGSDMRIEFSGFTVLKSGKIRDKISVSLLRDGVDCGSVGKFSEGEKVRCNLANILALHKLTNMNCKDDYGLDLLIIDELLDSSDESGLSSIFEALNKLSITSLVVSHGNIAEGYPYKTVVTKHNGVSQINVQ